MKQYNLVQFIRLYSTRGKKLKPTKPQIVVLNPEQAGLLTHRHRRNTGTNNNGKERYMKSHHDHLRAEKNSLFEGIELEPTWVKKGRNIMGSDLIKDTENLLKFQKKASVEQLFHSIDSLKPTLTNISQENYTQLQKQLTDSFTIKQLREYINTLDPQHELITSNRLVKHKLIEQIFTKLWSGQISQNLLDLQTKTIKLTQRHSKLLLLTQNGKILKNLTRLNPHLFIQLNLSQNELRITSTVNILEFIEISLNNILNNVCATDWSPTTTLSESQLNLITRICGVDIYNNEVAAFGWKRIELAKRLVRWIISKEDSLHKEAKFEKWLLSEDNGDNDNIKWFPFNDLDCLDWLDKDETWGRLQKIEPIAEDNTNIESSAIKPSNLLCDEKIDEIYNFFKDSSLNKSNSGISSAVSNIVSISFGSILETKTNNKRIFQPRVSKISEKVLALPPDSGDTDTEPSYYLELNFTPSSKNLKKFPPLKLLIQLDEKNNIIYETIQCLTCLSSSDYYPQTPQLQHDYKISHDKLSDIFVYDNNGELTNQPGIDKFLNVFKYTPQIPYVNSTDTVSFNLPIEISEASNVDYEFVSMNHHSVRRFQYLDKYSVQFSNVNGGSLGGCYTQVEFVNDDNATELPSREDFGKFLKDIFKFD
ncbi:similar to Saccharomyces cerevisiae YLR139C SLS1 Mitochondrial membrane protein that coordinates expression of mitochondrially-encoded genes [Maudiozyma barnettii]|uniref:Similar to Saccharomyces cerevisiae YLR139C SLS1 Mitochondrial membrane protein that coordinates expression of mitochondrially-encoded genes n=1 Tax=Maudiozyma barnettii TaxID=61262 RepID=A0A8H2ZGP4_9SACH|nr:Sls1p [Kazachstania barnettii]CAB4254814.1 similar to Saccharomyces cerevisiae YLR139C SLS1 Mitochondrial membrane protein that coordinates expression of mitochondrially-encoded genes [Kazachstania barnettii]CAD1782989.1 similar to Saccharomyces cerevisiae YLR139C SLS1 Mitochondrial membrane protein that coordinates expression of mitochondrially-encoded genes [Kazachstania barnettii]